MIGLKNVQIREMWVIALGCDKPEHGHIVTSPYAMKSGTLFLSSTSDDRPANERQQHATLRGT